MKTKLLLAFLVGGLLGAIAARLAFPRYTYLPALNGRGLYRCDNWSGEVSRAISVGAWQSVGVDVFDTFSFEDAQKSKPSGP